MENNERIVPPPNGSTADDPPQQKKEDIFQAIFNLGQQSQNWDEDFQLVEIMQTVRIRKPKDCFVRTNKDLQYGAYFLEDTEAMKTELYMLTQNVMQDLADQPSLKRMRLIGSVDHNNLFFFWPIPLPRPSGRTNEHHQRAMQAAARAEKEWLKLTWDEDKREHRIYVAESMTLEPKWPTESLQELLRRAFSDRIVADMDHPLVRRLKGRD
jgi:hypothetical protein